MNRSFYYFGIFISALFIIISLFQSLIYLEIGGHTYTLQSFPDWFLFGGIISLLSSFVLLKYYRYKKYSFAFSAALVATIATLCHFIMVYNRLMAWEWGSYYLITGLTALGIVLVYSLSLIFSNAGKRAWLKAGGVFTFIFNFVILASVVWGMNSREVMVNGTVEKIHQWTGLAGSLLPVFFIVNFLSEVRILRKEDTDSTLHKSWDGVMIITGITAIAAALFLGPKLSTERYWLSKWFNRSPELAQALAEPFEARTYANSKDESMQYRFMKPLDYDSTKKYPLVVCLHGGAGWGTDNFKQIEGSWAAMLLSENGNRKNFPSFLFVPQCPPGFSWGGIPTHPGVDSLVFEIMAELEKEFPIDVKKRYVIGESLGGYGSWYFIGTRPEMFAAAIPICGEGNPDLAKNMVDVSVWAFHGEKDRNVPVKGSRNMIDAIKMAGGNPRYNEFPDAGHLIKDQVNHTPGVFEWLFEQKRD